MKFSRKMILAASLSAACVCVFAQEQKVQKKNSGTQTTAAAAQTDTTDQKSDKKSETSVENEYLNDVDGTVIITLAQSDEYDNKLVALQYLENAVDGGKASDDVIAALDQLAGEGINTQNYKNGRLMNNYPDIRRQACLLLGKVGDTHSKNTLKSIAVADSEPMVQAAAIRSLGEIGINDNDEVTEAIAYANYRNRVLNPTSSMAFEVLNAFEKLSGSTQNKRTMIEEISHIASDYHYNQAVRKHALDLLKNMKDSSSSSSSSKSSDNSKKNSSASSDTTAAAPADAASSDTAQQKK